MESQDLNCSRCGSRIRGDFVMAAGAIVCIEQCERESSSREAGDVERVLQFRAHDSSGR